MPRRLIDIVKKELSRDVRLSKKREATGSQGIHPKMSIIASLSGLISFMAYDEMNETLEMSNGSKKEFSVGCYESVK